MASSKKINITELDFDLIKQNLKEYLKGQSEFQDYDFEGSGFAVLLDVLAYNTHYNALYDNLAVNELFLDSAIKRSSVVSIAKMLGYTPRSASCAQATVNISITSAGAGPQVVIIPAYSEFTATIDGQNLSFYNLEPITSSAGPSNLYTIPNVKIIQGEPLSFRFTVSDGARYIIPNPNVDLNTLRVRVQENSQSSEFNTYTRSTSIVDAASNTRVYWVKEIDDGLYELTFGDGVLGQELSNGNIVNVDYLVSSLDVANGARVFSYNGSPPYSSANVSISTVSPAAGGFEAEEVDSIKFNAPRSYAAQNRAVTTEDYKTIIYNQFAEASSVTVWGGEDNNPPVYGKTFICVKPRSATKLTNSQKSEILNTILTSRNVVSVIPEIVDPEYINIALDCTVYYDPRATTRTGREIENLVRDTIINYDNNELQKFEGMFRHSKLSRLVDATEKGIISNNTTVLIRRQIDPRYNISAQYLLNIVNPIYTTGIPQDSIRSTGFFISNSNDTVHYLDDDGVGNIRLFYIGSSAEKIIVDPTIGTVDYAAGIINIKNLLIAAVSGVDFELTIKPSSYDVVSAYTQIAQISRDYLTVTAIPDQTISGDTRAGKNYVFTSSRS
jgi:hypothetical protein